MPDLATLGATELQPLPSAVRNAIEEHWQARAAMQHYGKPHLQNYKSKEIEFYIGATAALNELGYIMPPSWYMAILAGSNIK